MTTHLLPLTVYAMLAILSSGASSSEAACIIHSSGASCLGHTAELRGAIIGTNTPPGDVLIFWGKMDGGTNTTDWNRVEHLGKCNGGPFSKLVMGLEEHGSYFYRCALSNANGLIWADSSTNFSIAVGFGPEEVKRMRQEAFVDDVRTMQKQGVDPRRIAWFVETEDFNQRDIRINSWDDWAKEYNAIVLDPPVVFDVFDPPPAVASNPTNALHIILHAFASGNVESLHTNTDDRMRKELEADGYTLPKPTESPKLFKASKSHLVVVLCSATKLFAGREYVLLISRRQSATRPTDNWVTLEQDIFVKQGNRYLWTSNLRETRICSALSIPETHGILFGQYKAFHQKFTKSQLPKHFYTIEDPNSTATEEKKAP